MAKIFTRKTENLTPQADMAKSGRTAQILKNSGLLQSVWLKKALPNIVLQIKKWEIHCKGFYKTNIDTVCKI